MKYNYEHYKKVMHNCLCQTVMFKKMSDYELLSILKGLTVILTTLDELSEEEVKQCLILFWQEYNLGVGCTNKMSDDYIRNTLIPAVLNHPEADLTWGATIYYTAKIHK